MEMTKLNKIAGNLVTGLILSAVLVLPTGARASSEPSGFQKVVAHHIQKYPAMEVEDLYKLAFQAAMGSEHAVPSREAASQWLERELLTLSGAPGGPLPEPLTEPLSPDGSLVRVNLRTLVEQGGDTSRLLSAFVQTARELDGSQEKLASYWSDISAMAEAGQIPFEVGRLEELWETMRAQGFPAVRHSTTYRDRYHPAYRVVLVELMKSKPVQSTGQ